MNFATAVALLVLALILFLAIRYIYKEKKKGTACIGCPYAGSCHKHKAGGNCMPANEEEKRPERSEKLTVSEVN